MRLLPLPPQPGPLRLLSLRTGSIATRAEGPLAVTLLCLLCAVVASYRDLVILAAWHLEALPQVQCHRRLRHIAHDRIPLLFSDVLCGGRHASECNCLLCLDAACVQQHLDAHNRCMCRVGIPLTSSMYALDSFEMRGPSMLLKPAVGLVVLSPPNCSSIAARGSSHVTCG